MHKDESDLERTSELPVSISSSDRWQAAAYTLVPIKSFMKMFTMLRIYTLVCLFLGTLALNLYGQDSLAEPKLLRVMSFNLRYGTANDGENRWELRKENVLTTILESGPDVLGVQETLDFQADFLSERLVGYDYFGRSREDRKQGEQCGILFKSERFDLLESGHFWLSETPNIPGSKSWDSSLPRMASWVKLVERNSKIVFYVVNSHFDHRGSTAREKSAEVILERIKRFEPDTPIVLTGDFNTAPGSAPHQVLSQVLVDTYAASNSNQEKSGTFGGFKGRRDGARIDFIFASQGLEIESAGINYRNFDGRDPSDHFPVEATFQVFQRRE